jgi:hypothetical protein
VTHGLVVINDRPGDRVAGAARDEKLIHRSLLFGDFEIGHSCRHRSAFRSAERYGQQETKWR